MKLLKLRNPFKNLYKFELRLWIVSLIVVSISSLFGKQNNILSLIASLIGVTALIFVAKGDVFGQILTVIFSVFYAIISYTFQYYGEMITYLCMSAPIAALSVISWIRNPYRENKAEVKVNRLKKSEIAFMIMLTILVTIGFYFILGALNTTNLFVSTISVTTSFSASYLMFRRSAAYALAYAANDVVLIILWVMASLEDLSYLAMVACFLMFLANDLYAFFNWSLMKKRQV